jgi:hypothetical protein
MNAPSTYIQLNGKVVNWQKCSFSCDAEALSLSRDGCSLVHLWKHDIRCVAMTTFGAIFKHMANELVWIADT